MPNQAGDINIIRNNKGSIYLAHVVYDAGDIERECVIEVDDDLDDDASFEEIARQMRGVEFEVDEHTYCYDRGEKVDTPAPIQALAG